MDLNKTDANDITETGTDKVHEAKAPTSIVSSDNSFKFNFSIDTD